LNGLDPLTLAALGSPLARQVDHGGPLVAATASESPLAVEEEPLCHDPLALVTLDDGDRAIVVVVVVWGSFPEMQVGLGDGDDDVHAVEVVVWESPLAMQEELGGGSDDVPAAQAVALGSSPAKLEELGGGGGGHDFPVAQAVVLGSHPARLDDLGAGGLDRGGGGDPVAQVAA